MDAASHCYTLTQHRKINHSLIHIKLQYSMNSNIEKNHQLVIFYADNTFLPLARRRANTLRPPTVAIRALKP